MCLSFSLSPLDSDDGSPIHSFIFSIYCSLFAFRLHFGYNNSENEKKNMQFRSDCECKQNKSKSYSLFIRCHYCLWYFCHHISSSDYFSRYHTDAAATAPSWMLWCIQGKSIFPRLTYTLHTYSIYYCCSDFSLFVKHFCTGFKNSTIWFIVNALFFV